VSAGAVFLLIAAAVFAQVPSSQHVILVIEENSTYSDVLADMPWLTGMGSANGYASNYTSDTGGSLMDYLWLASGSCHSAANCTLPAGTHDFNCSGNDCYYPGTTTSDPITDDNIFREMNNAGISWKVYAESYSAAGGTPTSPDNNNGTDYYRRHNGATWYSDILSNVNGSANNIVDLSQLATDVANGKLPRYAIIVPDGNHDAHDCPVGMNRCTVADKLGATDSFLSSNLAGVLALSDFQPGGTGLLAVTFDECGEGTNSGCGGQVYTALIGPQVTPGTVSTTAYKHENLLRTLCDALNITTYPGAAATVSDMADFFSASTAKPTVSISTPGNKANVGSPANIIAMASPTAGHTITGWWVYVDSVETYGAGAVNLLNASVSMKTGTHTVLVRVWDTSGAYGDQTITLTVSSKPAVTVSTPLPGANVISPINVQASATASSGRSINKWYIYLDGKQKYSAGAVSSLNTNITASKGTHSMSVRAYDTTGAYETQMMSITVGTVAVNVSTPFNNASVDSPATIQATAQSANTITGWVVYVDSVDSYTQNNGSPLNASVAMTSGTHSVLVRAWDSTGAYGSQTITLTVP
jgi:hypothetical protein